MAHLPADILQMIFAEVEKDLPFRLERRRPVYGARRETGRNISLVCRAWRKGGKAIRWRYHNVDFTSRTAKRDVQHLLSHRRAASSVRMRNLEALRFCNAPRDLLEDLADDDARLHFSELRALAIDNTPARRFGGNLAATGTAGLVRCAFRLKRLCITADAHLDMDDDEPEPHQRPLEEVELDIRGDGRAVTDLTYTVLRCAEPARLESLTVKNVPFSASFFATIGTFRNLRQLTLVWPTDDAFSCTTAHLRSAIKNMQDLHLSDMVLAMISATARSACVTLDSEFQSATQGPLSSFFTGRRDELPLEELVVVDSHSTRCFRKADQSGRPVWRDVGGLETEFVALTVDGEITFFQKEDESDSFWRM
ncbi:hypothetical protein JCM10296v2_003191 [Rhodotorula toruloides]